MSGYRDQAEEVVAIRKSTCSDSDTRSRLGLAEKLLRQGGCWLGEMV
jgi:hypothetical protein